MLASVFVLSVLGLLVIGFVGWMVAGEIGERRKARAAARAIGRYQRKRYDDRGESW